MPKGISRKINLANYGGHQYEMIQVWVEEGEGEKKSFEKLEQEMNDALEGIIHRLPIVDKRLGDAVDPTVTQSESIVINEPKKYATRTK